MLPVCLEDYFGIKSDIYYIATTVACFFRLVHLYSQHYSDIQPFDTESSLSVKYSNLDSESSFLPLRVLFALSTVWLWPKVFVIYDGQKRQSGNFFRVFRLILTNNPPKKTAVVFILYTYYLSIGLKLNNFLSPISCWIHPQSLANEQYIHDIHEPDHSFWIVFLS